MVEGIKTQGKIRHQNTINCRGRNFVVEGIKKQRILAIRHNKTQSNDGAIVPTMNTNCWA
jgi:hypothetical protein